MYTYMVFLFMERFFYAFVLYLCGMPHSSGHQVHTQPGFYLTTQQPFAPASSTQKHYLSPALQAVQQDSQRIRRLFLSYSEE